MSALQTTALIVVVVAGTAVVLTPEPLRQTMVLGIFGFTLAILFFTFQAPDVALSEIVVSGVGMPLIILAALRKIRSQDASRKAGTTREPARAADPVRARRPGVGRRARYRTATVCPPSATTTGSTDCFWTGSSPTCATPPTSSRP